jgi:hypothetical protein
VPFGGEGRSSRNFQITHPQTILQQNGETSHHFGQSVSARLREFPAEHDNGIPLDPGGANPWITLRTPREGRAIPNPTDLPGDHFGPERNAFRSKEITIDCREESPIGLGQELRDPAPTDLRSS